MTIRKKMNMEEGIQLIWLRTTPTVSRPHRPTRRRTFTRWRFSTLTLNRRPQNNRFRLARRTCEIRISVKIRKAAISALRTSETPTAAPTISIVLWARTWLPNRNSKEESRGSRLTNTMRAISTPASPSTERTWTILAFTARKNPRPSVNFPLPQFSKTNSIATVQSWLWKRPNRRKWKERRVSHLAEQLKRRHFTTTRMHRKRQKWVRQSTERPWSTRISTGLSDHSSSRTKTRECQLSLKTASKNNSNKIQVTRMLFRLSMRANTDWEIAIARLLLVEPIRSRHISWILTSNNSTCLQVMRNTSNRRCEATVRKRAPPPISQGIANNTKPTCQKCTSMGPPPISRTPRVAPQRKCQGRGNCRKIISLRMTVVSKQ